MASEIVPSFGQDTIRYTASDVTDMLGRDLVNVNDGNSAEMEENSSSIIFSLENGFTSSDPPDESTDASPLDDDLAEEEDQDDEHECYEENVKLGAG